MSKLETITIDTPSGSSALQIGDGNTATIGLGKSGDTLTVPSGATLTIAGTINASSGTATGFGGTPFNEIGGCFTHGNQTGISSFSYTKILLSSTTYNKGLTFGSNKITIPSGAAGKYNVVVKMDVNLYGADKMQAAKGAIYINGSGSKYFGNDFRDNPGRDATILYSDVLTFAESDYIEIYAYIGHTQSTGAYQAVNNTSIQFYKVNET